MASSLSRHCHSSISSPTIPPSCPALTAVMQPIRMRPRLFLFICELLQQVCFDVRFIAEYCLVARAVSWSMPAYAFFTALRYNPLHGRSFLASASSCDGSLLRLDASTRMPRVAAKQRPRVPFQPPKAARRLRPPMRMTPCVYWVHVACAAPLRSTVPMQCERWSADMCVGDASPRRIPARYRLGAALRGSLGARPPPGL